MSNIVAAAAVVHAPQLLSRPPHEDLAKLDRSTAALRQFGDVIAQTEPDAVILIGLDHLETFWLDAVPAFTVVLSPQATAHFLELTALGAHPLLALSARQVSEIEQRRQDAGVE